MDRIFTGVTSREKSATDVYDTDFEFKEIETYHNYTDQIIYIHRPDKRIKLMPWNNRARRTTSDAVRYTNSIYGVSEQPIVNVTRVSLDTLQHGPVYDEVKDQYFTTEEQAKNFEHPRLNIKVKEVLEEAFKQAMDEGFQGFGFELFDPKQLFPSGIVLKIGKMTISVTARVGHFREQDVTMFNNDSSTEEKPDGVDNLNAGQTFTKEASLLINGLDSEFADKFDTMIIDLKDLETNHFIASEQSGLGFDILETVDAIDMLNEFKYKFIADNREKLISNLKVQNETKLKKQTNSHKVELDSIKRKYQDDLYKCEKEKEDLKRDIENLRISANRLKTERDQFRDRTEFEFKEREFEFKEKELNEKKKRAEQQTKNESYKSYQEIGKTVLLLITTTVTLVSLFAKK